MTGYGNNTFQYGADGIRCRKNNIHYTLDGSRILQEYHEDTGETLTFYYGEKGVFGFRYRDANGAENDYFYRKNLFGDVLAIYNANGQRIANYRYDAWGYHIPEDDDDENLAIKNINPFRYRSYYYDTETCLYYLESRYYDPELCRFLNPDTIDYLGDGEEMHNYNLFAYCGNNPVMYSDPTGHIPFFLLTALALGVVGAAVGGLIANQTESNILAGMGIGFAIGAIVGAAIGMAVSYSATGTVVANFADIRFGYALKAAQKGNYNQLAKFATHNKRSKQVGLGKYIEGSPNSYEALSKANKYTYYELKPEYWEKTKAVLGNNTWEVNRTFLDQQVAKGKIFIKLSNDYTGDYLRELRYLKLL